jgi:hypothetical protein
MALGSLLLMMSRRTALIVKQLQPQMEKTEENLGGLPKGAKMSWDNGYYNGQNLHYLEEKGVDG